MAGFCASNQRFSGKLSVMNVGILSSASGTPSLSESQSEDNSESSVWSKSMSTRVSLSSSSSIASGPVVESMGFASASPSPKSSWSQGLVELRSKRVGQRSTSSSSFMPSSSSSSSISSRVPSLSWSNGAVILSSNSTAFVNPSPSQSSSAQFTIPSLSWSQVDCSSPQKQPGSFSWSTSIRPSLSSSWSSPSGIPSLSLSTS